MSIEVTIQLDQTLVDVAFDHEPRVEVSFDAAPIVQADISGVSVDLSPTNIDTEILVTPISVELSADTVPELTVEAIIGGAPGSDGQILGYAEFNDPTSGVYNLSADVAFDVTDIAFAITQNQLNAGIAGHTWFDGNVFRPFGAQAYGKYRAVIEATCSSLLDGDALHFSVVVPGTNEVIAFTDHRMFKQAGDDERISTALDFYVPLDGIAGLEFRVVSDTDATLTDLTVLLTVEAT